MLGTVPLHPESTRGQNQATCYGGTLQVFLGIWIKQTSGEPPLGAEREHACVEQRSGVFL